MGIKAAEKDSFANISNAQKSFFSADKLIINNEWSKKVFSEDYMISRVIDRKILLRPTLKNNLNLKPDEKVHQVLFAYTWKNKYTKNLNLFKARLIYIDKIIDQWMRIQTKDSIKYKFVLSIHHILSNKKFKDWFKKNLNHLELTPEGEDIYETLSKSKTLISDFSSIIIDAAWYKKRIIIDFSELNYYRKDRGVYEEVIKDMNRFDNYKSTSESIEAIFQTGKDDIDYDSFNLKYNGAEFEYI